MRGQLRSKTLLQLLQGCCSQSVKPCFAGVYQGVQMCKVYIKPWFLGPFVLVLSLSKYQDKGQEKHLKKQFENCA